MTLVTKAEFARRHGVSKPAVQKWEKNGWLVLTEGKVDAEASDKKLAKYRDSKDGRATAKKPAGKPAASKPAAKVNPPVPTIEPDETPEQAAERIVHTLAREEDGLLSIEDARRLKENYLGLLNQLEYEQKDGALVDLATAEHVLFEATRAARDAWLNWPARVGPQLAAELGLEADKVTEALSAYVHKQIAELGEPEADFAQR